MFGYKFVAWASIAIAAVGFFVWGHHMFVSGQSVFAGLVFSFMSFIVAVPSAIKVFNWTATLHKGWIHFDAPMLYALAFIGLFTIGGLTGLFLACLAYDVYVTDTYFVVAHFHYIMVGGMVTAYFGGLHYWWPKITGRMYPEYWARAAAILIFFGFNLTFFPQFILGVAGHAAALSRLSAGIPGLARAVVGRRLDPRRRLSACRCSISAGRCSSAARAPANPWHATGLEWQTPSPPPDAQFRDDAGGDARSLSVHARRRGACRKMPDAARRNSVCRPAPAATRWRELGMWVFLATEVLFFGGLILGYCVYRIGYPAGFAEARRHTKIVIGTANTAILLTSSFLVAWAVDACAVETRKLCAGLLSGAILLGLAFLVLKGVEYADEYREHLVPGIDFNFEASEANGAQLFFVFYFRRDRDPRRCTC